MATKRIYATGKRKTAIARVWISLGSGKIVVNKRPVEEYFVRKTSLMIIQQPFETLNSVGKYDVMVNVLGGGLSAQAEAVRHGIARALCGEDLEQRPPLKKAGFLTRDDRKKERKKYGQPGARKKFQYSKR